jgi:hypothetical protein
MRRQGYRMTALDDVDVGELEEENRHVGHQEPKSAGTEPAFVAPPTR